MAEKLLTYGLGRGVEPQDMPLVRSIVRDAAAGDYRFSTLVLGVVKSAPFQNNIKGRRSSANGRSLSIKREPCSSRRSTFLGGRSCAALA